MTQLQDGWQMTISLATGVNDNFHSLYKLGKYIG